MAQQADPKSELPSGFDALRELHAKGATGVLVLRAARFDDMDVYFMDGQVIACSAFSDEWLMGRLLVASGAVAVEDMQRALDGKGGESLIDFLMQNELMSMDSLQGIQGDRFRDNLHFACVTPWSGASFSKQDAVFPPDMQLGFETPELLDQIAEWYEHVQPLLVMQYRSQDPVFERVPKSRLGKGELKMIAQLVKDPLPLSTLMAISPLPRYRTLSALAQLVSKRVLGVALQGEGDIEKASLTGELEILNASLETSEEAIPLSTMEIEPLVAEAAGLAGLTTDAAGTGGEDDGPDADGLGPDGEEEDEEAFFVEDVDELAIGDVSSADIEAAQAAREAREAEEDARIAALRADTVGGADGGLPPEDEASAEAIEELDESSIAELSEGVATDAPEPAADAGDGPADATDPVEPESVAPDATDLVEPEEPPAPAESHGDQPDIDYEKGNVKVYDVLDKVDLSHVAVPGEESPPPQVEEIDGAEIAAVEHSIELGEGSEDLVAEDEGMIDTEIDPDLLSPDAKVAGPTDGPGATGETNLEAGAAASSELYDSSAELSASGEVPPIHLSGTDDSVEFFIDEGEDGEAVVRISESSIPAIEAGDARKLKLPRDIPFKEDDLLAFLQRIQVFNRIFRVIFESFSERLGAEATLARFNRFLGDKSLQYPTLFEALQTEQDGTLDPAGLIVNLAKAEPQDHEYFLHEGLYDLIYIHLYDAKDVLSPDGERGMMDQIVAFEEQLHRP